MQSYSIDDCVVIASTKSKVKKVVGKIKKISGDSFFYSLYLFPEDCAEGRLEYNSQNEVYLTDVSEVSKFDDIQGKCEVITFEAYLQRKCGKATRGVYFYRQTYLIKDKVYKPDLYSNCFCHKIFNPDQEYSQCPKCHELYHLSCLEVLGNGYCPYELCKNKIISNKNNEENNGEYLGAKRERTEKAGEFKNLPEENRKALVGMIELFEKKNQGTRGANLEHMNEGQIRFKARDFFTKCFLYGIEELKLKKKDFWEKKARNPNNLNQTNINSIDFVVQFVQHLADVTESSLHNTFYGNRAGYQKQYSNLIKYLNEDDNTELRGSILLGEIQPAKVSRMSVEDLEPMNFKRKRQKKQEKFFKEQVYLEEDTQIIAKTHKGDTILKLGQSKNEGFIPFEVLERKTKFEEDGYRSEGSDGENEAMIKEKNEKFQLLQKKYPTLSIDKIRFYIDFDNYKVENLDAKINRRIKNYLCDQTRKELNEMRKKLSIKK